MKRWIMLAGILVLGLAAIVVSERRKVDVPAGPAAVLYLVADTEQELTRMPVSFTRLSDEEEIRIGDLLARNYEQDREAKGSEEIVEVERYLAEVGSRLVPHAHRKLPYKFHYIPDENLINAFAIPGGHVFVGAGLLSLMDSEDELAAVMGHEIEHIDHYHCAERVQREQALRHLPFGGLVAIPVEVFEAGYSKDQELEADREGTKLSVEAGYSANGAIRMFETFERLHQEYETRAKSPQQELTNVALETLGGYFRSHPLPSERIAQIQTMIASEHWPVRPERDLAVAYIFQTSRARYALAAHKYSQAAQLASHSLQVRPNQPRALEVLAAAEFAQADFAAAADAYRLLVQMNADNYTFVEPYASALGAADHNTAAVVFTKWIEASKDASLDTQVPQAGLKLLAGNPEPARQLQGALNGFSGNQPTLKSDLGWWYYRAGDYHTAAELLEQSVQLVPGDMDAGTRLAWTQIENHRLSDALQSLNLIYEDGRVVPERLMARAVAKWQGQSPDAGLEDYKMAVADAPEWTNPRWVKALYSPGVSESVQQMHDEVEKRRKATLAHNR
jgi:predicted Zn-dependent protease